MTFSETYFEQVTQVSRLIDRAEVEAMVDALARVRERGGRVFVLGVGGSAANAAHAVNDFRKLCAIEAYAPTDNVSELTARTNDEGWATVFSAWLSTSKLGSLDAILIFSVGGGDLDRNVSPNLVEAIKFAKTRGCTILGVVGRDGGYTKRAADQVVLVPTIDPALVTPHTEAFQAVIWHCMVSHPRLQVQKTKW